MRKMHLTTFINADRGKVWHAMLDDATYRIWTSSFMEGSYYRGSWESGAAIRFLAPNRDGAGESGMLSYIRESRPYEFVSIEHRGMVKDGVEDTTSDEVKKWAGALENYTFVEKDGGTELIVDMDVAETEYEYMESAWKKAIVELRTLAEK